MKTLSFNGGYITIMVNKSLEIRMVELEISQPDLSPDILFSEKGGNFTGSRINIRPEETLVVSWK